MSAPVSPLLGDVLRSARPEFNARFVGMKRRHPDINAAAFSEVLRAMVDPLVKAVGATSEERVPATVWAAYDAALMLVAEKLAGPGGRYAVIEEAWRELLPGIARLVAESPGKVIGAVTNALCHLTSYPGIRAAEWNEHLLRVAPALTTVDILLKAGQVTAWRCGLAHYREGALSAAEALPPEIALRLVGAPVTSAWTEVRARLEKERWWNPAQEAKSQALRVVRRAGSFRGFGGLFSEPPIVASAGGQIFVRSGEGYWLLTADAFGATFHRADAAMFDDAAREKSPLRFVKSCVMRDGEMRELPKIGDVTSAAATNDTVAVTGSLTHSITLLAMH